MLDMLFKTMNLNLVGSGVGHFHLCRFNFLISCFLISCSCLALVYFSVAKRVLRTIDTVCDACGKTFATSNGFDTH
jgi:hypothetical protein